MCSPPPKKMMSVLGKEEVGGGCEHDILGEGWYQEFEGWI